MKETKKNYGIPIFMCHYLYCQLAAEIQPLMPTISERKKEERL